MQTNRKRVALAVIGATALTGMTHLPATRAQDVKQDVKVVSKAHVIIHTPEGDQELDVDLDQLSPGGGNKTFVVLGSPDGQLVTSGDFAMLNGSGMFNGMTGIPQMGGMNIIDPGQSYLMQLLKREDVRAQLYITPHQREALDGIEKSQQESVHQQLKQRASFLNDDIKGKTLDEIGHIAEQHAVQMSEQIQNVTNDSSKKLASILTAPQRTRLEELDKQWRGPLALGVTDVAQQAQLTEAQAPVVTDLLKQYHKEVSSRVSPGSPAILKTQNASKGNGAASATPSPQEQQAKMEQMHREIEKARQALGEKALNGLNAKQRAQWSALTGKPFVFRTN